MNASAKTSNKAARKWAEANPADAVRLALADEARLDRWGESSWPQVRELAAELKRWRAVYDYALGLTPELSEALAAVVKKTKTLKEKGEQRLELPEVHARALQAGLQWSIVGLQTAPPDRTLTEFRSAAGLYLYSPVWVRLDEKGESVVERWEQPGGNDPDRYLIEQLAKVSVNENCLSALAVVFTDQPTEVEPETRSDRIIPGPLALARETDSRVQKRLYSPAAHIAQQRDGAQLVLPGFREECIQGPCLPLELFELGGGQSVTPGRGGPAPVSLRLFVEAVLSVPVADRDGKPRIFEVAMRGLAQKLWPEARVQRRNFEALARAAQRLDSLWIPIPSKFSSQPDQCRVVLVTAVRLPEGGKGGDPGQLRFVVDLPLGSARGPIVSPRLNDWAGSAPAYRGLLNLAYRWHHPGKTRYPVRGGNHWLQTEEASRYDRITDDLLIETFYPVSAWKNRRRLVFAARRVLAALEEAGEVRVVQDRILPPKTISTDE